MESNKVAKNGKSITLGSGVEITYCEFGEEHNEVMVMGEFYFHSFVPMMEELAKKYHVYGVVMSSRPAELCTEFAADGEIDWPYQWGKDIYDFTQAMGLTKFIYVGKCHGSVPGWCLLEKHPEVLDAFIPISLPPMDRTPKPLSPERLESLRLQREDPRTWVANMVRKPENIEKKLLEMRTINIAGVMGAKHRMPLEYFKTNEDLFDFFKQIKVPMMYMTGMDDDGFRSGYEMIAQMGMTIPGIKIVMYYGERHFIEMDIPQKLTEDIFLFLKQIGKDC